MGDAAEDLRQQLQQIHDAVDAIMQSLRHARWQLEHVFAQHRTENGDDTAIDSAPADSPIGRWREGLKTIDDLIGYGAADEIVESVMKERAVAYAPGRQRR